MLYNPNIGILNAALHGAGLERFALDWLGDSRVAIYAVIAVSQWQYTGYIMMLFLVAIQKIPPELYEAAMIDGANRRQLFRRITLPLLKGVSTMVILLNLIGGVRVFDIVYVMTKGGPNHNTEVLATHLYEVAFWFNKMGYASVIAVIILVLSLIFAYFRNRLMSEEKA
jgi:raffinose/stachyose/melibiose transport system permease protein